MFEISNKSAADPFDKCREMAVGRFATSLAGHDVGRCYVIVGITDDGNVLLADGERRKVEKPKVKKLRHISISDMYSRPIAEVLFSGKTVSDAEIRYAVKAWRVGDCKEAECQSKM